MRSILRSQPFLLALVIAATATGAGAQVQPIQPTGQAPLVAAIRQGDLEAARAQLQRKADVNQAEPDGTTALHWAAHLDNPAAVELLLKAGANATATNRFGASPLSLAAMKGNAEVIRQLVGGGADPNLVVGTASVLMLAARAGNADAVKHLLAAGADPNFAEKLRKQTALMWAAARGNAEVVKQLVASGARLGARSRGPTCGMGVYHSCQTANPSAQPDQRANDPLGIRVNEGGEYDDNGDGMEFTAFLFAARAGQIEVCKALLDAGVDPNEAKTDQGTTGLILAIMNRHWELAGMLLDRGADPRRGPGYTALHQLAWSRRLNQSGATGRAHPVSTGRLDSLDLAKQLIQHGVDVNARMTRSFRDGYRSRVRRGGSTAFLISSKVVDVPMMRLLVEAGADITIRNVDNDAPLMLAAGVGTLNENEDLGTEGEAVEAVKYLLELGADPQAVNNNGENAMHGAIGYRGWLQVAQILNERGVRFDQPNILGWTPVQIADGVFVAGFLKAQPKAAVYARELYAKAGMPVPPITKVNPTDALTGEAAAASAKGK